MRILIAPNAFKNSLSADAAAVAIAAGLQQSRLRCDCVNFPVGDGGDGTANLLIQHLQGRLISAPAQDALGRDIHSHIGLMDGDRTAVIELADFSGLRLLKPDELNPLMATTHGTGDAIRQALDKGVQRIVLAIGGSATVDGAAGLLHALGARFLDASGKHIEPQPCNLQQLESIDISSLDARLMQCELIVLCDVDNPLLGAQGAAAIFGPQKGATASQVATLDAALTRLAHVIQRQTGRDITQLKHGGAAGGVAASLHGLVNAQLVHGIEYFLDTTHFDTALGNADLVITGEGRIDEQTLQGKAPYGVARRAKRKGIPVVALAGSVPVQTNPDLQTYFDVLLSIGAEPGSLDAALQRTAADLERTATQLGNLLTCNKDITSRPTS